MLNIAGTIAVGKIKMPFTWRNLLLALLMVVIAYLCIFSWKIAVIVLVATIHYVIIPLIKELASFIADLGRIAWSAI